MNEIFHLIIHSNEKHMPRLFCQLQSHSHALILTSTQMMKDEAVNATNLKTTNSRLNCGSFYLPYKFHYYSMDD